MAVEHAILLSAGEASRLEPLTQHRPKGMLLVGGKPLLQHALEAAAAAGVRSATIVLGRHGDRIQAFFKDGADFGVQLTYANQDAARGTAHAVRCALARLAPKGEALIVSGHLFLTASVLQAIADAPGAAVAISLAKTDHPQGIPTQRGSQLVRITKGTPTVGSTRAVIGLVKATPALLDAIAASAETDLDALLSALAPQLAIQCVDVAGSWEPLVDPWDLLRVNEVALDAAVGPSAGAAGTGHRIGANCSIASTARLIGPVTLGDGCTVGDFSVVGPYVSLRNGCSIGAHCEVRHSILNNNVAVDSRSLVRGSILDDGVRIGAGFLCDEVATPQGPRGCIVGADGRVRPGSTLAGGTIVPAEP